MNIYQRFVALKCKRLWESIYHSDVHNHFNECPGCERWNKDVDFDCQQFNNTQWIIIITFARNSSNEREREDEFEGVKDKSKWKVGFYEGAKNWYTYWILNELTFGENRQMTVTLADKLIVTDIDVSRRGTWLAVPKYKGTNASHITHVVYIVNPFFYRAQFIRSRFT